MSRKVLGLDIRSSSATAVLMETGLKKCAIVGFGHTSFPGEGSFQEKLSHALSVISAEMDLRDCVCAMSLPSSRFFYRNVSVPFGENKKIQQMLPYELESVIPLPVEELLIDFNKISLPGAGGETRIIAACIETEKLKSILDTLEESGVSPGVVFPCGYGAASWICNKYFDKETLVMIDFDGEICSLYLLFSGAISLVRSFPLPQSQAKSAIYVWGHIQRSIAGFESLFEIKVSPSHIIINGFPDEKFPKQLETVSAVSVETLDLPLPAHCEVPPQVEKDFFSPRSSFNGSLSCALYLIEGFKGMNFRKGPLAAKNRISEYRDRLVRTSVIAGVVLLLWIAGILTQIHMTQTSVDRLTSRITEIFKLHFPNNPNTDYAVHQMQTQIDALKKATFSSGNSQSQVRAIDLLRDISRSIPSNADVSFSKLNFEEDGIYIDGTTSSFNLVDEIKSKIEKIKGVASVTPTSSREGNSIRFKLRIETNREKSS